MVYPNTYLRTFWNPDLRHEIFVAMSFAPEFKQRYERVIAPAIRSISLGGAALEPKRVDLSRSGDSIITEIMDGIAHSQLVLADVTSRSNLLGESARNGNVMYELGISMACRQPTEVLIVRSDNAPLLFDVTTIPHKRINFTRPDARANGRLFFISKSAAVLHQRNQRQHLAENPYWHRQEQQPDQPWPAHAIRLWNGTRRGPENPDTESHGTNRDEQSRQDQHISHFDAPGDIDPSGDVCRQDRCTKC